MTASSCAAALRWIVFSSSPVRPPWNMIRCSDWGIGAFLSRLTCGWLAVAVFSCTSTTASPQPSVSAAAAPAAAPSSLPHDCVDVGNRSVVRSGDFVAGPFDGYIQELRKNPGGPAKLWWQPDHPGRDTLEIAGTRLDGRETYSEVLPPEQMASGSQGPFFPDGPRLPTLGRWRLVVTHGTNNWGCFELIA